MIGRGYGDLLPAYLSGDNIRKHAGIIEGQDKIIDDKIELLRSWNRLERPILIERVQEEPGRCTVNVHVNTQSPIRSVSITVDGVETVEEYAEDDVVTGVVLERTATSGWDVMVDIDTVMPDVSVEVECYDGTIYRKGYPENDVQQDNIKDHDEFLDIVGNLLGVPRRTYNDPDRSDIQFAFFPPYFSKRGIQDSGICTEDDYYYSQRLQKFINGLDRKDFVVHMAEVLYEWKNSRIIHCENRTTYLYDELEALVGENKTYDLVTTQSTYWNMDYSNMQEILSNYYPITRLIFPISAKSLYWRFKGAYYKDATNTLTFTGTTLIGFRAYLSNSVYDVVYYDMMKKESASETVIKPTGYDSDWVDCTHLITYNDIFASIQLRDAYELTVYVYEDYDYIKEYLLNVLTEYCFSSLDDIIELIGETNNTRKPFNLANWYCTYDEDGEANGLLNNGLYFGKLCNNFTPSLPDSDWLVCMEFYTNQYFEKYGDTVEIAYLNTVEGSIVLKVEASNGGTQWSTDWNVTIEEYTGTTLTGSTSVDDINLYPGSLVLERSGNRISFAYIGTTGNRVLYQRDYTGLSVCGCLYVRNYATWKTRLNNHYRYRIGEYNSDKTDLPVYKTDNWTFTSRGTGSTDPTISNDGILTIGKNSTHTYTPLLDTNKKYTLYIDTPNPNGAVAIGITNTSGNPVRQLLNTGNGAVIGLNKATLQHDGLSWYISFNEDIQIQLDNRNNPQLYLLSNQYNTASQHRILAITETNGGGAITNKYSILIQEDADTNTFNLNNWTGTIVTGGTGRSITQEGKLNLGRSCNNHTPSYPSEDWIRTIDVDITQDTSISTHSNYAVTINYNNNTEGATALRINKDYSTVILENGQVVETLTPFVDATHTTNSLRMQRQGNKITFSYYDVNGEYVSHTRTYNELRSNGNLYIRTYDDWNVELSNNTLLKKIGGGAISMNDLPIYDENNWAFISRGTESTEPVITDEGTLQTGIYNYHTWKQAIDTNKKYNIYFYKETIYYDMLIGVGNSNTTLPTRYPAMTINQSKAGITSQSINKATIYYDNSTEKWYIMVNDNPQYVKEQIDNNTLRYIIIGTTTSNTASQNKILAITEETNEEEEEEE